MFHTLLTLSYTIPGVYLFFRIMSLFIEKRHRIRYIIIFAFLFSIYPISNLLGEDEPGALTTIFASVSGYLLPFFLYLFISLLLTDIFLLINLALRIVSKEKISSRKFRNRYFAAIVAFSAMVVAAGIINFNTIRITEYSVTVPRRSSHLDKLKIAFVSDMHLMDRVPVRFAEKFAGKIREINPDVMLFGGDIVEGGEMGPKMVRFEEILAGIKTSLGVYGVAGNHEGYGRANVENFFAASGIKILKDTALTTGNSIVIAGREDSRAGDRVSVEQLVSGIKEDLPVILLDHRPADYISISKTRADIILSGHSHHGQLFPINLITNRIYELSYGYLKKGNNNFFVSSGIRLWGPPVRTTARSEIMVIDVEFRSE
jgi:predicted MPP superfamily phosphohydrolase